MFRVGKEVVFSRELELCPVAFCTFTYLLSIFTSLRVASNMM